MAKYLGIDVGSTSIKGGVIDVERDVVEDFSQRPFPPRLSRLPATHFEVSLEPIVRQTHQLIVELIEKCSECAGILFSSQMGGVILARPGLQPLTNYISWRDQRSLAQHSTGGGTLLDEVRRRTTSEDLSAIGKELQTGSATSILLSLAETGGLPGGEIVALNLGDYVVAALCRGQPQMEATMSVGIIHLPTGEIHRDWLERLGVRQIAWPPLVQFGEPAGTLHVGAREIPCYPAVGDHQAALLGAGVRPGELSINISTGSQAGVITESLALSEEYQTRPFFGGRFLNTITHLPAGRALNALVDMLTELPRLDGYAPSDPWRQISRAVEEANDDDLDLNVSFFDCAVGNRGRIQNMRLENMTVGQIFRAAFRNMVDNYVAASEKLSPARQWSGIVLSGGLSRKFDYLRELLAQRFNAAPRVASRQEETLEGLLVLAKRVAD